MKNCPLVPLHIPVIKYKNWIQLGVILCMDMFPDATGVYLTVTCYLCGPFEKSSFFRVRHAKGIKV